MAGSVFTRICAKTGIAVVLLTALLGAAASAAQAGVWRHELTPNPGAAENAFLSAAPASPSDVWAVGRAVHGEVIHLGGRWRPLIARRTSAGWRLAHGAPMPADTELAELTGVASSSSTDAWAVGTLLRTHHGGRQLAEHWNGHRWNLVSAAPFGDDQLEAVTAVPATSTYWAVGALNADAASAFWNGTTWQAVPVPVAHPRGSLHAVAALAPNEVWAVGSPTNLDVETQGRPFAEHWDGTAWSRAHLPGVFGRYDSPALYGMTAVPGTDQLWAVGANIPGRGSREDTLLYHFDGTHWHLVASPDPRRYNGLLGVTATSANNVWAFGASTNRGHHRRYALILHLTRTGWHVVQLSGAAAYGVLDAGAVTSTRVVAVGATSLNELKGSTIAASAPRIGSH